MQDYTMERACDATGAHWKSSWYSPMNNGMVMTQKNSVRML